MLSPMPLRPEVALPLLSTGDQLLANNSPLEFTISSPGTGRTPGAHVVQEGRLSLEMFGLVADAGMTGHAHPGATPDLLATMNSGTARATAAGFLKSSAIGLSNPTATNQQPKLTPPVLAGAASEHIAAKEAFAAKMKQELPGKLAAEASQIINNAKNALGLPEVDTSKAQRAINAVLAEDENAIAAALLQAADHAHKHEVETAPDSSLQPQRTSRRVAAKRAREIESSVDPATLPPPKRIARIEALYDQLRHLHEQNRAIAESIRNSKKELELMNVENENLWAATAHIGAAMHAAVEERDITMAIPSLDVNEEDYYDDEYDDDDDDLDYEDEMRRRKPRKASKEHKNNNNIMNQISSLAATNRTTTIPAIKIQQQQCADNTIPDDVEVSTQPSMAPPPPTTLVPVAPLVLTPGTAHLAALFSPNGDDLFAACNMFVSPADRLATGNGMAHVTPATGRVHQLFSDGTTDGKQQQQDREKKTSLSEEGSFSFKL